MRFLGIVGGCVGNNSADLCPMPAVGDRIARITARNRFAAKNWHKLYEIYPKQIKQKYGINFSEDLHISDANVAAFGAKKIGHHKTIYPAKGCFVGGGTFLLFRR